MTQTLPQCDDRRQVLEKHSFKAMAILLKVKWEKPSAHSFILMLLERRHDGLNVSAFCRLCDKEEMTQIEDPQQSRHATSFRGQNPGANSHPASQDGALGQL